MFKLNHIPVLMIFRAFVQDGAAFIFDAITLHAKRHHVFRMAKEHRLHGVIEIDVEIQLHAADLLRLVP